MILKFWRVGCFEKRERFDIQSVGVLERAELKFFVYNKYNQYFAVPFYIIWH